MIDQQQAYALIDAFCVVTRCPGERGAIIENARDVAGNRLGMLVCDDGVADAIDAELNWCSLVGAVLSVDGNRLELVRIDAGSVLTDGRGRYFDIESRRPVDRDGNRVTPAQAEHIARNWAARRMKQLRRAA